MALDSDDLSDGSCPVLNAQVRSLTCIAQHNTEHGGEIMNLDGQLYYCETFGGCFDSWGSMSVNFQPQVQAPRHWRLSWTKEGDGHEDGSWDPNHPDGDGGWLGVRGKLPTPCPTPTATPTGPTPTPGVTPTPAVEAELCSWWPGDHCHRIEVYDPRDREHKPLGGDTVACLMNSTERYCRKNNAGMIACDEEHSSDPDAATSCPSKPDDPRGPLWTVRVNGMDADWWLNPSNFFLAWVIAPAGSTVFNQTCPFPDFHVPGMNEGDWVRIPVRGDGCSSRTFIMPRPPEQ